MNYCTSYSEKYVILKPLLFCPLGIYQFSSRWWAVLCRSQRDKGLTSLTSEDLWPIISHVCGLGRGPARACRLSELEARPPLVKPWDDHSSRWHLVVALWETLSQHSPSPDPPLLYPSCLHSVGCPLTPGSSTPFSCHPTTVSLQGEINSSWHCPTWRFPLSPH